MFLKKKSRVHRVKCGDNNNKIFFQSCKGRWNSNKIISLENQDGKVLASHAAEETVNFFKAQLGENNMALSLPKLSSTQAVVLSRSVTEEEIDHFLWAFLFLHYLVKLHPNLHLFHSQFQNLESLIILGQD